MESVHKSARVRLNTLAKWNFQLLVLLLPLFALMAVETKSFTYGWTGRGFLIFVALFFLIELLSEKPNMPSVNRKSLLRVVFLSLVMATYFGAVYSSGLKNYLIELGYVLAVPIMEVDIGNWLRLIDALFILAFMVSSIYIMFGKKGFSLFSITLIYLTGISASWFLDSFFPYDRFTPLQVFVPITLMFVIPLLEIFGIPVSLLKGHILIIVTKEDIILPLAVYWPCAGIQSIMIYSLVIVAFMSKLAIDRKRAVIYAIAGFVGTFFVNVLRISLISYYGYLSLANIELFHKVIGEVLFIIWITVFLVAVVLIERKLRFRNRKSSRP